MIVETEEDLVRLKDIGRICATAVKVMAAALEPGITTRELDLIGRKLLEGAGCAVIVEHGGAGSGHRARCAIGGAPAAVAAARVGGDFGHHLVRQVDLALERRAIGRAGGGRTCPRPDRDGAGVQGTGLLDGEHR